MHYLTEAAFIFQSFKKNSYHVYHRNRVDSGDEFPGLKTTVFGHFWAVSGAYKRHTPLHIGLFSPQICTDLRGGPKIRGKSAEIRL